MATSAQTIIDAIDDAIAARLTNGAVKAYSVDGLHLETYSLQELRELRAFYEARKNAGKDTQNLAGFRRPS